MFDQWEGGGESRTLRLVDRTVWVDMRQAIPGCIGGFMHHVDMQVRASGLRLETWHVGHQIAWIRTHANHWIGIVQVKGFSANGLSSVEMTLWLPPKAFQAEQPNGYLAPSYGR